MVNLRCIAVCGVGFSLFNTCVNGLFTEPSLLTTKQNLSPPTIFNVKSNTSSSNVATMEYPLVYYDFTKKISIFIKFNNREWEFYDDTVYSDISVKCDFIVPHILINTNNTIFKVTKV